MPSVVPVPTHVLHVTGVIKILHLLRGLLYAYASKHGWCIVFPSFIFVFIFPNRLYFLQQNVAEGTEISCIPLPPQPSPTRVGRL